MNITSAIKQIKRVIPKKFRKPTLIEQRKDLNALRRKILANHPTLLLDKMEQIVKTKGKKSKEFSMLKSQVALDFCRNYFKFNLTLEQKQKIAELMAQLEYRENTVKSVKRNKFEDEYATNIRQELITLFPTKKDYKHFLITYRLYGSELKQILRKAGL